MKLLYFLAENHKALGAVSFTTWSTIYFIISIYVDRFYLTRTLTKLSRVQITLSYVSAIQGFVCGGIGILAVLTCKDDVLNIFYPPVVHYCTIGTGYFMYDLIAMYYANLLELKEKGKYGTFVGNFKSYIYNSALMIAHHIILTSVLFPALITYSRMGHFFAGCFFCMELSSPFVNFRIILSRMGWKTTKMYLYNGIFMMIVFAVFRVLIFIYMYFQYTFQQSTLHNISVFEAFLTIPITCHCFNLLIISPQLYWLSMMINGVFSVLAKKPKALDKYD